MKALERLAEQVAEQQRMLSNMLRPAVVASSEADGRLRVQDSAGLDVKVAQAAISSGAFKFDAPAQAGAQGLLFSPSGNPEQGIFLPCLPSAQNPAASDSPQQAVISFGESKITISAGKILIEAPEIELKGAKITTTGTTLLDGGGAKVKTISGVAARVTAKE